MNDPETRRREPEAAEAARLEGTAAEREERREQHEVEVQVRRGQPRPRRGRRKVGAIDEDLAARAPSERVTAGLSKVRIRKPAPPRPRALVGRREDEPEGEAGREPERPARRDASPVEPQPRRRAGRLLFLRRHALRRLRRRRRCSREAQRRKRSTPKSTTTDCQRTVCEEEKRAGRCAPIQKSDTTRTRLKSWIAAKPSDEPDEPPPPGRRKGEHGRAEEQRGLDAVAAVLDLDGESRRSGSRCPATDDLLAERRSGSRRRRARDAGGEGHDDGVVDRVARRRRSRRRRAAPRKRARKRASAGARTAAGSVRHRGGRRPASPGRSRIEAHSARRPEGSVRSSSPSAFRTTCSVSAEASRSPVSLRIS